MVVYVNGVCLKEFELAIDLKKCKANRILDLSNYLKVEAMAGHNESEKKSSDAVNDLQTFRAENLQSNMKVIYYSRTFLSIIGGVIAGILGLTGLTGFVFYFLMMTITSVALIAKAKFSIHTYFDSWNRVLLDGFLGGLMSFVLFWTGRTWMLLGTDTGKHLASKNRDINRFALSTLYYDAFFDRNRFAYDIVHIF
ncbi:hypothetical protein NC651_024834 [Populus alba x Populus x berolinensis]|nr:hypothetical protein NC651_024834 [Populus alba x Populus x berolinensis]